MFFEAERCDVALLGLMAAKRAAELRVRAEDARRRAIASADPMQKAEHLRRQQQFDKMAASTERP